MAKNLIAEGDLQIWWRYVCKGNGVPLQGEAWPVAPQILKPTLAATKANTYLQITGANSHRIFLNTMEDLQHKQS